MIHISQDELLKNIEKEQRNGTILATTEDLTSSLIGDMSSILPKNYANRIDRNNNSITEDDEIQTVIITGCGSKIGRTIAVAFARLDLKVALVDFDMEQTESVAKECEEQSPKKRTPLQIVADISQLDEAHKVIDRTIKEFGRLDVLVNTINNASLVEANFKASGDDDPHVFEQYHKIIANNMHSVTYLCISAAPHLKKTRGSIVNVSGITNTENGSYKFAYCMSKAGISTLTRCLATDLAPDIKVICVTPKNIQ